MRAVNKGTVKKIVFLSGAANLREGGEFSLLDVLKKIRQDYCLLCVCKQKGELPRALNDLKIPVLFCNTRWSGKLRYSFIQYWRLLKLYLRLRAWGPDLIYANSGRINPFAARLAKILRIPLITHIRDLFDPTLKDKFLLSKSSKIIVCSQAVASLAKRFNQDVEVIYNGVDPQKFSPRLKSFSNTLKNNLNLNGCFVVGNVGTIAYRKGYFEFVEVASRLTEAIERIKFMIIGEPLPDKKHILTELNKKIDEYGLREKFVFPGFVKDSARAIASLDVLLFPPRYEAFGRVIIEAFACGVPVVSTYSGGPEEIIQNQQDGFLLKNSDIQGMAEAISKLYHSKQLYQKISENGYRKFIARFTSDQAAERIKAAIQAALKRG